MRFTGKLRKIGGSLMVTIPVEIVEKLKLKENQIHELDFIDGWIKKEEEQ